MLAATNTARPTCSHCDTINRAGAKFCRRCGHPLAGAAGRGERKLVTVMFADISGFTARSEHLDPEEVVALINACFEELDGAVRRYEGTIDKFIGDAMMVIFGAPATHEDDAERAVRCALEMQARLAAFGKAYLHDRPDCPPLAMHIGINTGVVVAGDLGTARRRDYTVMGDVVNLASRLESAATAGQILIGASTYRLVAPLFKCQQLPPLALKGKHELQEAYAVIAPTGVQNARGFDRAGARTPLKGRDHDLAALGNALAALRAGHGGVTCIVAEAGLGKSRLVTEARERFGADLYWVEARSVAHGATLPYHALRNGFALLLGITPDTPPADAVTRIREILTAAGDGADLRVPPLWPHMVAIQGYPLPDDPAADRLARMDNAARRAELVWLLRAYWRRTARRQPSVLVGEDLHWADPDTLQVLRDLLPLAHEVPLQILLLYRPEREGQLAALRAELEADPRNLVLLLAPLTPEHSRDLVAQLLDRYHLPPELYARLLAKAEGNPFYLEEVSRALIDSGLVGGDDGLWMRLRSLDDLDVPDTLHSLIATRVDRLRPELKTVLQRAAVVGRHFSTADVLPLVDEPAALAGQLAELVNRELLKPDAGRIAGSEYAFQHALIHEVAYSSLLKEQRRALHRRVAAHLSAGPAQAGLLAYHYERAEDWADALRWLTAAAREAYDRHANLTALDLTDRALAAWDRLYPEGGAPPDALTEQIALYELLAAVAGSLADRAALQRAATGLIAAGAALADPVAQVHGYLAATHLDHLDSDWDAWERDVNAALALAEPLGDRALLSQVYVRQARLYTNRRGPHAAIPYLRRSAAYSYLEGDEHELATAANNLALAYTATGEIRRAAWHADYALKLSHRLGDMRGSAVHHLSVGRIQLHRGRLAAGLESMRAGQADADRTGQVRPRIITRNNLSIAYAMIGLYEPALACADEAARMIAEHSAADLLGQNIGVRVDALLGLRRHAEAGAVLEEIRAGHTIHQLGQWYAALLARQAMLDWLAGRPAAALAILVEAAPHMPHLPGDLPAYTIWAAACLDLGDLAEATSRIDQALRWLAQGEHEAEAPFTCAVAARVYTALGRPDAAAAHAARARDSFHRQWAALPDPAWRAAFAARWTARGGVAIGSADETPALVDE